jgi:hypothetical protein
MKVLELPGGQGGLRRPYLMPPQGELDAMAAALARLGIDELDERLREAGRRA